MAPNVSVFDSGEKPPSSSRPGTFCPPCQPPVYWPRALVSSNGSTGLVAERTFTFSARRSDGAKETGSSIAVSASSWSRWFWITSRVAPMPS